MTSNDNRVHEKVNHEMAVPPETQRPVVITDLEYLRSPKTALDMMRSGSTVVVEPENGGARMVLFGELLSDVKI